MRWREERSAKEGRALAQKAEKAETPRPSYTLLREANEP